MSLLEVASAQKRGEKRGITSICSSHPWVIKAALNGQDDVLIEATCNQVNQYGGYTGMTPANFYDYVKKIAEENRFPFEKIILGGDHLGPNVWQDEPAAEAMQKSKVLVMDYVKAGFRKIHLDCSMRLADDPPGALNPEISARRATELAKVAENNYPNRNMPPLYVIGSEVPTPGGTQSEHEEIHITRVQDVENTLAITEQLFKEKGLDSAWTRVIAVVVQPGIDYGDNFFVHYDRNLTHDLSRFIETQPLIYEAHSTDYQSPKALSGLVEDHFAILKVGPALTSAFREAVFSLALIENELIPKKLQSNLITVINKDMIKNPKYWGKYFKGSNLEVTLARKYSLSDRIRYYWMDSSVQNSLNRLILNLTDIQIPGQVLHQYGLIETDEAIPSKNSISPQAIIINRIDEVLQKYRVACQSE